MKKLFLKTLLTTLVLLTGGVSSAWAATGDVTTNADIDFSNAITGSYSIAGTVGSMTWTQQWTYAPAIIDGILYFGNTDDMNVELQNNTIRNKDKVSISFELAFSKLNKKHIGFKLVDGNGGVLLQQWFDAYNGDFDDANPLNLDWASMFRNNTIIWERRVYFDMTFDYAGKIVTTKTKCYLLGAEKPITESTFEADWISTAAIAKFVLQGNLDNDGRPSAFDNLKITTTEGDYSAATAKYTVKYLCDSEEIKEAKEYEGDVDSDATLSSADKANFFNSDESARYIYDSDDSEGKTIAADGSTVVTVNFRNAEMLIYTIKATCGDEYLQYLPSDPVWEDLNTVTVSWPRYIAVGKKLYERKPVSNSLQQTFEIPSNMYEIVLPYTATDIVDLYKFSEAENLGTSLPASATTFTDRVSNGQIIYGASGDLLKLLAGTYKFTLGVIGGDNNTHKVNYVVYKGEQTEANKIAEGTCTGNFLTLIQSEEFTLTEETTISFTCSDPASTRGIDLVYVQGEVDQLAYAKYQLQKAINAAKALNTDGLSEEKISYLTDLIGTYEDLLTDETATAEIIQTKSTELATQVTALQMEAEAARETAKYNLSEIIYEAKAIETEGMNGADDLAAAISEAETILTSTESKYQDYIDAKSALDNAIAAFQAANFDPNTLIVNGDFEGTYESAYTINTDRYVYKPEGWTVDYKNVSTWNMTVVGSTDAMASNFTDSYAVAEGNNKYMVRFRDNQTSEYVDLSQTVTVPYSGAYTFSADMIRENGSKINVSLYAGENSVSNANPNVWENRSVTVELEANTEIKVGVRFTNLGADGVKAGIDNIQVSFKSFEEIAAEELAAAKEELQEAIEKAVALKTAGRTEGLDDYKTAIVNAVSVYNNGTTAEEVNAAIAPLKAAETAFLVANKPIEDGTYYVYNPLTKKFLARGNTWGTSAVVADYGVAITVTSSDANYSLVGFDNNAFYGFDEWMYADAGGNDVRTYILDKVENGITMTNTNNSKLVYVYLKEDGNKYRVAGNAIKDDNYTDDAQTVWQFITPKAYKEMIADRIETEITAAFTAAEIAEDAEVEIAEPVELTFASGHGWTQTVVREQKDQPATNGNGTEMWQATGYYTQTVSDLPSGLYKVSIQAFYRNGGADECVARYNTGDNTVLAYLDANGCKAQVKSWAEDKGDGNDPNDMGQAKDKFDVGKYVSETYAYVGEDGELNLTVYNPAFIGNGWFIVSNVKYAAVTLPAEPDVVITAIDAPELLAMGFSSEVMVTVSSAIDIENAVVTLKLGDREAGTSEAVNIAAGEEVPIPMMVNVAYGNPDDYLLSATLTYDDLVGDPISCADEVKQTVGVTSTGDPNGDFEVTVSDAALTVMFALGTQEPTDTQFKLADVNKSDDITVSDAVGIVYIAGGGMIVSARESERSTTQGVNYLTQDGTEIGLVNTTDFVGFQMDVTLSDGAVLNGVRLTERASGLQLFTSRIDQNTWRIIALSLDGTVISGNEGTLLSLDITGNGQASFSRIEFTDTAAQAHQLGFVSPTGINVLYNNKVDGEVYTLGGTRTGNLKKGINVVRQADGSVRKVLVK